MDVRAVMVDGFDGVEAVRVGTAHVADPAGEQVRVRVIAAGVGPWDVFTTDGAFAELLGDVDHGVFPMVLGWDFAGVVQDAGPLARLRPGRRVMGMTRQPIEGVGCHAELVTVSEDRCVPVPDDVSDVEAATLPCCALTAWQALAHSGLGAGDHLLVVGAAGQLGGFVTQLAADRGVRVIASVSESQADTARRLGAAAVIDRDGDLADQVRAIAPNGVDGAFDPVGVQLARAIRDGGRFVRAVTWSPPVNERGISTHTMFVEDDRDALARVVAMLDQGTVAARVGEVIALSEARRAYEAVQAGGTTGKIVLDPAR